jgi:hypothetical protein
MKIFAFLAITVTLANGATAQAAEPTLKEGRCLVEYEGGAYLDAPCTIAVGGHDSCSVGGPGNQDVAGHTAFVIVNVRDKGFALTNANHFGGRATWIGDVTRDGACWGNASGKVCAWAEKARH